MEEAQATVPPHSRRRLQRRAYTIQLREDAGVRMIQRTWRTYASRQSLPRSTSSQQSFTSGADIELDSEEHDEEEHLEVDDSVRRAEERLNSKPRNDEMLHSWPIPLDQDNDNLFLHMAEAKVKVAWPVLAGDNDSSSDEVIRWVQDHGTVLIRAVTWNLQGREPPEFVEIQAKLLPLNKFHIYVIGTEECERSIASSMVNPSKKLWEAMLKKIIGPHYAVICSHTLQAIHSIAFVHKALLPFISEINSVAIATGIANTLGNKGAVALSFKFGSTSLLFINAHLAAHQHAVKTRNLQYMRIMTELYCRLTSRDFDSNHDTTESKHSAEDASEPEHTSLLFNYYDRAIFSGDLNYRIRGNRKIVELLLSKGMHEVCLANDQLLWSMEKQLSFQGFREGPLHFRPTYKFDKGCDVYDSSLKQRIPAWTDRILYKPVGCELITYQSEPCLRSSDHRPVYASFKIAVNVTQLPIDDLVKHSQILEEPHVTKSEVCSIM